MAPARRSRLPIDPDEFGQRLANIRRQQGYSQEDLSFAMQQIWKNHQRPGKISTGWVQQVEQGMVRSVDRMRILCAAEALGVPITQLLPPLSADAMPQGTETDIALALRAYGLNDQEIERVLEVVRHIVAQDPKNEEN
ncbi:MAG: hypothetical protein C7B44_04705 [Sulfobacillus thermosulfidooxidans]|nr:MAG: hypothetical protein C7B44_04705 [Sulfobacillus thermosulfidooxidans]